MFFKLFISNFSLLIQKVQNYRQKFGHKMLLFLNILQLLYFLCIKNGRLVPKI